MKKHDPAMAVCPNCGSRLVVSGRVGHSEVYSRRYLCGAIYHDERLDNSTEVCREIERLRAELLNRIGWHRRYSDGIEEVLRDVREYKKSGEVVRSDREEVKRLVVKIKRLRTEYDAVLDAAVESDGRWMQAVSDLIAEQDEAQRELAKAREIIECRHDHD